jgi:hypothetical protein
MHIVTDGREGREGREGRGGGILFNDMNCSKLSFLPKGGPKFDSVFFQ